MNRQLAAILECEPQQVYERIFSLFNRVLPAKRLREYGMQIQAVSYTHLSIDIFSAPDFGQGCLDDAQRELIAKVRAEYNEKMFIQCTACGSCMPCPGGVNIPGIFRHMNDGALAGNYTRSREHYADEIAAGSDASHCRCCGKCQRSCPQGLPIIEKLKQAHQILNG